MGLFAKKTAVCVRCGKEFQTRSGRTICDECINEEIQRENDVAGYIRYAKLTKRPAYTQEQLVEIAAHRNAILERYNCEHGITRSELMAAGDNYSSLTEDQAVDILTRAYNSMMISTMGASYTDAFFVPSSYERTVVDKDDVFAVAYTTDCKCAVTDHEAILCVLFTNDPYLPAFPMLYLGKIGFFELTKSRKGRESVEALFTSQCPNLTYPVQNASALKKQLRSEKTVHGNIPLDVMLTFLSDAKLGSGIFKDKDLESELPSSTKKLMEQYHYLQSNEISDLLKLNKMFSKNFWKKISKNHPECGMILG